MSTSLQLLFVMLIVMAGCRNKPAAPVSCGENQGKSVLIFVGEPINIEQYHTQYDSLFDSYIATCKISQLVCGNYLSDTIRFATIGPYGTPAFTAFKNVLLFVERSNDSFLHIGNQYFDVYKAKDGRWAGAVNYYHHLGEDSLPKHLLPTAISFADTVWFDLAGMKKKSIRTQYPSSYYAIQNNKAVASHGYYLPALVEIAKRGFLRQDGYFGEKEPEGELVPRDIVFTSTAPICRPEKNVFDRAWTAFIKAAQNNDTPLMRLLSADSVTCSICEGLPQESFDNEKEPVDTFIKALFSVLKKDSLWQTVLRQKGDRSISFIDVTDDGSDRLSSKDSAVHYVVTFNTELHTKWSVILQSHRFLFKKVGSTFMFAGVESNQN